MRMSIMGQPGSGKTFMAEAVAKKLSIPHIHIDRFWFEAGGRQGSHDTPNIEQVRARVKEKTMAVISGEAWVSDGFYSRVQPEIASRADVVIFLDIPLWQRLSNHVIRLLHPAKRHSEINVWDDLRFFYEIVRRTFTNRPKLQRFLNEYKDKVITLRSRKEIDLYLQGLN